MNRRQFLHGVTKRGRLSMAAAVFVASGAAMLTTIAVTTSAQATTGPLVGPLAVSGTHLVDEGNAGKIVTLRGVNILADTIGVNNGGMLDSGAFNTLVGWNVNFVRLNISSDAYLHDCPGEKYDPNYGSELSQAVSELTGAGIYVLLSIQTTNPNCHWSAPVSSTTAPLPGEDIVPALTSLTETYGANKLVGFELFNEPQACAEGTAGPGASTFVPSYGQPGEHCTSEQLAALAWNNPGTVRAVNQFAALGVGNYTYATPGMDTLYATVMDNASSSSPPLVFLDSNYFATDNGTFDDIGSIASAQNVVEVFHGYDCIDTSSNTSAYQNANCHESNPETCSVAAANVNRYMFDPAGAPQNRPVVFDEFNFPAHENEYQAPTGPKGQYQAISVYQHGYWVNNEIAAMQSDGSAGWAAYFFMNADQESWTTPYDMLPAGITSSTPTPWPVSDNDGSAVAAMKGTTLACETPPAGYDLASTTPSTSGSGGSSPSSKPSGLGGILSGL
ncbi:MAG: cellulase family glycosylhydrolase [Acidimicrobiales bacterium]